MKPKRLFGTAVLLFALAGFAQAAPLACKTPGVKRWAVKTTLPQQPKTVTMTLADALNLARLPAVKTNDARYDSVRILDQPVKEDSVITLTGWVYLVAFEADDCDFHIQISPVPHTRANPGTEADNCIIVEVPSGQYATTISTEVEGVRQWVVDNLLHGKPPTIGSIHPMDSPTYVSVTGALFYDDDHSYRPNGDTGRGKLGMPSKTLWELHPVTAMKFAVAPARP